MKDTCRLLSLQEIRTIVKNVMEQRIKKRESVQVIVKDGLQVVKKVDNEECRQAECTRVEQKEKESSDEEFLDLNKQLCHKLIEQRRIKHEDKSMRNSKNMSIFRQLESYIEFNQVLKKIFNRINIKYSEVKLQKQKQNAQNIEKAMLREKKMAENMIKITKQIQNEKFQPNNLMTSTQSSLNKTIGQINQKIQSEYGAKMRNRLKKVLKEEVNDIDQIVRNQSRVFNSGSFIEDLNFFERSTNQNANVKLQIFSRFQITQKPKAKPHKRLIFNSKDKAQTEGYYKEALTFLSLIIENQKRKTSHRQSLKESKKSISKIEKNEAVLEKLDQVLISEPSNQSNRKSERSTYKSSRFSSSVSKSQGKNISKADKSIDLKSKKQNSFSSSSNPFYSRHKSDRQIFSSFFIQRNSDLKSFHQPSTPTTSIHVSPNSSFIDFEKSIESSKLVHPGPPQQKKLKRMSRVRNYEKKLENIIGNIHHQESVNKNQKTAIESYMIDTSKEFYSLSIDNQTDLLMKQIEDQIIERKKGMVHRLKRNQ